MNDLSWTSDSCTQITVCCKINSTNWCMLCAVMSVYVFNELHFSCKFSWIWFIKLSSLLRLFSFFSILKSCFCTEFLLWFACIQRALVCWVISDIFFSCWFASLNFERSSANSLSLLIRACQLTSVNSVMTCCFSLFCCWSLNMVENITEFLCLSCDSSALIMWLIADIVTASSVK